MLLWNPVLAGFGTLLVVQREWSLDDLLDALLVLEAREWARMDG